MYPEIIFCEQNTLDPGIFLGRVSTFLTKMEKRVKVADVLRCEPCMFYTQRVVYEETGEDMMEIVLVTDYDMLGGGKFDSVVVARFGLLEGDLSTVPDEIIQKYMAFTGATYTIHAGKYTFYLSRVPTGELKLDKDIYGLWTLSSPISTVFQSSDETSFGVYLKLYGNLTK